MNPKNNIYSSNEDKIIINNYSPATFCYYKKSIRDSFCVTINKEKSIFNRYNRNFKNGLHLEFTSSEIIRGQYKIDLDTSNVENFKVDTFSYFNYETYEEYLSIQELPGRSVKYGEWSITNLNTNTTTTYNESKTEANK